MNKRALLFLSVFGVITAFDSFAAKAEKTVFFETKPTDVTLIITPAKDETISWQMGSPKTNPIKTLRKSTQSWRGGFSGYIKEVKVISRGQTKLELGEKTEQIKQLNKDLEKFNFPAVSINVSKQTIEVREAPKIVTFKSENLLYEITITTMDDKIEFEDQSTFLFEQEGFEILGGQEYIKDIQVRGPGFTRSADKALLTKVNNMINDNEYLELVIKKDNNRLDVSPRTIQ